MWEMSEMQGNTDLLSFTFDGPKPYNPNQPLFIDAEDPSRSFTAVQFRQLVRTLISGFQAYNIQPGDCVLLHLGNSVSTVSENCVPKATEEKQKNTKKRDIANLVLDTIDPLSRTLFWHHRGRWSLHGLKSSQSTTRTQSYPQSCRTKTHPDHPRCSTNRPQSLRLPGNQPGPSLCRR